MSFQSAAAVGYADRISAAKKATPTQRVSYL